MANPKKQQQRILLIEDDPNLGYILQENLELHGYHVHRCMDGEEGLDAYLRNNFNLCLIDVMLPKKDGFCLAKDIRKTNQKIPIIFLTAKSLKEDRIEGFKIGGDDYVVKPFSMEELVLRIQAVLKRTGKSSQVSIEKAKFPIGQYTFDYENQILILQDHSTKLTSKEAELLKLLCMHENDILDREIALKLIWSDDNYFTGRSMDVFISRLRKYLSNDTNVEIRNVHGKGFKLVVKT
ncbi:response regulator transcription factor [candidate division KSB1 bacterium]|nr:response regulator transcription factor [candidate division KSB1 bacterium]